MSGQLRPVMGTMVYALVLAALCVCTALFPRTMWGLFKSIRFKNPATVEPSDLVVAWYRIIGIVGAALFGGVVVLMLLGETPPQKRAQCEEVLSELSQVRPLAGFAAVEQRADELGLEVEEITSGGRPPRIAIIDDGERLGALIPPPRPGDTYTTCCGTACPP